MGNKMSKLKEFEYSSLQDVQSIVKYIEAIKQGFSRGRLIFGTEDGKMILDPQGLIKMAIKATNKNGVVRLYLRFNWRETEEPETGQKKLSIETTKE